MGIPLSVGIILVLSDGLEGIPIHIHHSSRTSSESTSSIPGVRFGGWGNVVKSANLFVMSIPGHHNKEADVIYVVL